MPRLMSFFHTQSQYHNRTKTVTRRRGWWFLKPGDLFDGVEKAQGIPLGGHVVRMGHNITISAEGEPLCRLIDEPEYGRIEVAKEGFPEMTPEEFCKFFCEAMRCELDEVVNRIEFGYLDELPGMGLNGT